MASVLHPQAVQGRTESEQHSQVSSSELWAAGAGDGVVGDKCLSNVEAVLLASLPSMRFLIPHLMRAATLLSVAGLSTALVEVGAFYWTAWAPDIVNPGRVGQGSVSL